MKIFNQQTIAEAILKSASLTRRECVLICPFVKDAVLQEILKCIPNSTAVKLITKANTEDVISGVNDPCAWERVWQRGGEVKILERLHSKYYRFDDTVFIGSANLTNKTLGLSPFSNDELIIQSSALESLLIEENLLWEKGITATREILTKLNESAENCKTERSKLPNYPTGISFQELTNTLSRKTNPTSTPSKALDRIMTIETKLSELLPPLQDEVLAVIQKNIDNQATFIVGQAKNKTGQDCCVFRKNALSDKPITVGDKGNKDLPSISSREALLGTLIVDWRLRGEWESGGSLLKRPSSADRVFFEGRDITAYLKQLENKPIVADAESLTRVGREHMPMIERFPIGLRQ